VATVYNVTGYNHVQNISRFKSFLFYLTPLVGVFEIYGFHKSCSELGLGGQNDNMRDLVAGAIFA
jgi:predicted MPP superfamily phosphohydrolase